jgi:polysaccharide export outer membrane protein
MKRFAILVLLLLLPAAALAAEYPLGPGDEVEISVWRDEALTRQLVVPPDGLVSFPLIADTQVTGVTVPALRATVKKKLEPFVPDAVVTVILLRSSSMTAYVVGKVNKPGQFPIQLDTTVMQLLAMAGGPNPYAATGKMLLLRQEGGKTSELPFDYDQVAKGQGLGQNAILRRGDVLVVP